MSDKRRYYRKVIRIRGQDSPNVQYAQLISAAGGKPPNVILPGVLPWADYVKRRTTWDKVRQCIGLDAQFWKGKDVLLYPPDWLNRAEIAAVSAPSGKRHAQGIGIDPAEGGDKTTMAAVDKYGLIELDSKLTPDTNDVFLYALEFIKRHGLEHDPDRVCFDRGGGGKQHADRLRDKGIEVRTVPFGGAVALPPQRHTILYTQKAEVAEERFVYSSMRSQLYGDLRLMIDPSVRDPVWGIPAAYDELRRQMALIPLKYDEEGRLKVPKKRKKNKDDKETTLEDIIGHSPDELDAVALAVHGMITAGHTARAGMIT